MGFSLISKLDSQEKYAQILVHLYDLGFGVKGALILAEKSGVLVKAASIAANSSSIGTELQDRLKQQRLKGIGRYLRDRQAVFSYSIPRAS